MPKLLDFITGIGGVDKVVDSIDKVIDNNIYSKEEKAADALKAQELFESNQARRENLDQERFKLELESHLREQELILSDIQSSRSREVEITKSDNVSWLQKNTTSILALLVITYTFVLWTLILFKQYDPKTSESMIIGGLTSITTQIIGYYFGSSLSSKSKDDIIKDLTK